MTVANTNTSNIFNANGVTREWNLGFQYDSIVSSLNIYVRHADGTATTVTTNYELDGNVLTYPTVESELDPLPQGDKLIVERVTPLTQAINLTQQGPLDAETLEGGYDKDILIDQELKAQLDRAIVFPVDSDGETDAQAYIDNLQALVTTATTQAGLATTKAGEANTSATNAQKWAEGTDEEVEALDGEHSAKGWASIAQTAAESEAVQTVASNIADVNTVAGISSDVTSVASISSAVGTVASHDTEVLLVSDNMASVMTTASNIGDVSTVAGISSGVSTVAGISSDIEAVADNATDISSVAANNTNITAVANNETNINAVNANKTNIDAVAGNSSNITAVAGNATNINAVNANKTNIDAVAGNATNINAVASDLTNIDTASTNMAAIIAAPTAATNAATSATNAQTWAEGSDADVSALGGTKSSKGWAQRAQELVESIGTVMRYKGSVANYAALQAIQNPTLGDTYNVLDTGYNYTWDGSAWDAISSAVDLSAYRTAADQDVIDSGKQATITGAATSITSSNLTASKALVSDANGKVAASSVTSTELGYVSGVTSAIQTQISNKQDTISDLETIRSGASAGATAVQPGDLATVATSGSYTDLLNKPTIPTVNNATLTIQKNGTNVATFTANSSSNATANITVPTQASDIGAQEALVSGTNIKTVNNNSLLGSGNISIDSLPSQTGNTGKFLTTDGSSASWATVNALPSQTGQSGKYLTTDGSAASWAAIPATISADGTTIENNSNVLTTIGVKDQNTSNAIKTWTGTKAQYDAIVTKDADTIYTTTDEAGDDTEFADTSLSNITNAGKIVGAGLGMPSSTYEDLTLGASGATYTMPANGWLVFRKGFTTSTNAFYNIFNLTISNTLIASNAWSSSEFNWIKGVCFPVKKNDVIQIDYSDNGITELFRFIYAEGSKSEA